MRLKGAPDYPRNAALGCIEDNGLIEEYGREVARQFRELGVHVNFAPDADVNTNPLNPVIHVRSFGENPQRVAEKVVAYSRGLESGGILSVCKHFPGHGDTDVDSHKALPALHYDRARLDSVELYPFKEMVRAGLGGCHGRPSASAGAGPGRGDSFFLVAECGDRVVGRMNSALKAGVYRCLGHEGCVCHSAGNYQSAAGGK